MRAVAVVALSGSHSAWPCLCEKYGFYAVFVGRFFGPLRASVPLAAGILEMPWWPFQIANLTSAFVWAAMLLLFGDGITQFFRWLLG